MSLIPRTLHPFGIRTPFGTSVGSPFQVAETLMRDMDRFWDSDSLFAFGTDSVVTTELYKTEDGYLLKALVPGFSKEQINVDVSKNHISIDAEKVEKMAPVAELIKGGFPQKLSYREEVRATLDPSTAEAELVNGVLTVSVRVIAKNPSTSNKVVIK